MNTKNELTEVAKKIAPFIHKTPVLSSSAINKMLGLSVHFKCENFQKMGAFKMRGAANAVLSRIHGTHAKHQAIATGPCAGT